MFGVLSSCMTQTQDVSIRATARIEHLSVKNYRALRDVELRQITPLTVLLGPNGSGKSTLFDVFNFLSECFQYGLRHAWDRRGRSREIISRGQSGPLVIELKYRERPGDPLISYHIAIEEKNKGPVVVEEWLQWKRGSHGRPFRFLDYKNGHGSAISGDLPDESDTDRRTTTSSGRPLDALESSRGRAARRYRS